ncbi:MULTISPECIES: F0F1 ATP synthase subunit epsilon [Mycobacteriales]|uniref:ATP synthase epsilon chain n=1 Tax=Gordonia rubripertincta TaxID=36822 RepID=A0ABT4N133_GORRU|nr:MULTISPECIES: F0F1 ATP synthase subunit epsilon [Mycobacteriales]MBA4025774.1 F0F1 ATP synthase subunit epsilon [Gordonia sp. (in: high G+C Gram-positive bacteria)]MCZ4552968.1 F0F1 ATP synthase subunit epsilon [Gordonia rubripertincta]ORM26075.1 F0F1 ATP synthase subunit epsilon [Williamsia sp. 1135]OZG30271.1 F0F1 ATP synthase subunit epsilon [Williamsia sp. 1138]
MADTAFHVEVVAVDSELYSGEATFVIAQTTEGELGVLANHEPLLGQLIQGGFVLIEEEGGSRKVAAVQGGFLSVTGETVTILAESAEWADDIDRATEEETLDVAEEGSDEYLRAQSRLRALDELGQVK